MFCDLEPKEDMSEEEIKQAEQRLGLYRQLVKFLFEWRADWDKIGIDYSEIDFCAKDLIATIGQDKWIEGRDALIDKFKKEFEKAEEMIKKSKEKLKKK